MLEQSVAFVAICLRVWVRIRDNLWGLDDAFVVLAGVASIVGDVIVCLSMFPTPTVRFSRS